ncbi:MAG: LysR family transcriptional regulator [Pseudomonadota bacterium]
MSDGSLSLRALRIFVAVVDEGSVTGGARALGLSASTVSQQLANLEAALSAQLIERSARFFMLTVAGEIFLPRARKVLDEVTEARAALAVGGHAPRLRLRVALIEDFDFAVAPRWLSDLAGLLGKCDVSVHSGASHENHAALETRAVDMIVAAEAIEPADWVETHPLIVDPYILVRPPDMEADDLDDLMQRPMVGYARDQLMARQVDAQLRRVKAQPLRRHEFTTSRAALAFAAGSGAWALTTALAYLGVSLEADRLVARPAPLPAFARRINLYARRGAMGELPALVAADLRRALAETALAEASARLPFVAGKLRLSE